MKTLFAERIKTLQREISRRRLAGLVVTQPANWFYLTGFTGESGALVVTPRASSMITDGRFTVQAAAETSRVRVVPQRGALLAFLVEFLQKSGGRKIGYDSASLTVVQFESLRKAAGRTIRWEPVPGLVEALRTRKGAPELAAMRRAALLASEVVEAGAKLLKPGVREFEVAAEIEYQMRRRGASGPAFETIVAFGERAALPHARPTAKRLRKNELVVLDLGAILAHYCSDITRTFFVGRAPKRIRGWYRAVQEAQAAAIATVGPGVACGEVDAAARQVLAGYHLDRYFVHSTGHGLGLQVHEEPRIAKGQARQLEPGNVVSIEPGVYVEGVGGIRIEDDVAVHARGSEVLTRFSRDLIEL
jgi:Xaa-Pro aminopeptidase